MKIFKIIIAWASSSLGYFIIRYGFDVDISFTRPNELLLFALGLYAVHYSGIIIGKLENNSHKN